MAGGRERFVDADLDAGEFGCGHAHEVEEVQSAVDERDVEVCTSVVLACSTHNHDRHSGSMNRLVGYDAANLPMPISFAFACAPSAATLAASSDSIGTCLVAIVMQFLNDEMRDKLKYKDLQQQLYMTSILHMLRCSPCTSMSISAVISSRGRKARETCP